jgi:hypothetical protein
VIFRKLSILFRNTASGGRAGAGHRGPEPGATGALAVLISSTSDRFRKANHSDSEEYRRTLTNFPKHCYG